MSTGLAWFEHLITAFFEWHYWRWSSGYPFSHLIWFRSNKMNENHLTHGRDIHGLDVLSRTPHEYCLELSGLLNSCH